MIFRKSKEKEEKIKEPYTKATAITQVITVSYTHLRAQRH